MFIAISDGNPLVNIKAPYVNRVLIAACSLMFVLQFAGLRFESYAFVPGFLLAGIPLIAVDPPPIVTLLSHQFLHGDAVHLVVNMVALWVFGDNVEDALGHIRYLLFFLLAGVAGAGAEAWLALDPMVPMIGASGAISGVMGAYLLLHPRAKILVLLFFRVPLLLPAALVVGADILVNVVMAFLSRDGDEALQSIAWWAHVGGFAAGMVLVLVMRRPGVALFQPETVYPDVPFPWWQRFVVDFFPRQGSAPAGKAPRREVLAKAAVYFVIVYLLLTSF